MALQTDLPHDLSAGGLIREYMTLVRDLSLQKEPQALIEAYRTRAQFVVQTDRVVSLSRRGMAAGSARITRSTTWEQAINPWDAPHQLPVVDSGLFLRLLEAGRAVKIDALEVDRDDPAAPYVAGMGALAAAPIFHEGEPLYMVMMMREARPFELGEVATMVLTANLIGRATEHMVQAGEIRRLNTALEREFRHIGEIQRGLLPATLPDIPGVTIATHYETSTQAGGDYYDFFDLGDDRWGILIADVSGHGASAAVEMARAHALLHAEIDGRCDVRSHPALTLQQLNRALHRTMRPGAFITAFFAHYHTRTRKLIFANAGHNAPRRMRKGAAHSEALPLTDGMPLAIVDELEIDQKEITLDAGDRLLLYTDGITETFDPRAEMFGVEGLDAAMRKCGGSAQCMVDKIIADVRAFGFGPPADDRTLVALAFQ